MKNLNFVFLIQFVFLYSLYELANALIGRNVREAVEGEFPNVVCIVRESNYPRNVRFDVRCTGAMITRDHILTSEHCFENMGSQSLYVLAESVDLRRARRYHLTWWITHNLWAAYMNQTLDFYLNDIAIVKLNRKIRESIRPAPLSLEPNENLFGLEVILVGWGRIYDGSHPYILHTVQTTIISNDDCEVNAERAAGFHIPINLRYLCSMADPPGLLTAGDSGGPVLLNTVLTGINQGLCPRMNDIPDLRKVNLHFSIVCYRQFILFNMEL